MNATPIQTTYAGCRFRSRLEARWAVAFDTMRLKWEYEPEGFRLPSGTHYLPDFRMSMASGRIWFEIKPKGGASEEFREFIESAPAFGAILREIPDPRTIGISGSENTESECCFEYLTATGGDWPYCFCACPSCNLVGFEFDGRSARVGCSCPIHGARANGDKTYAANHPLILKAFAAARSARFEHGDREDWG